MKKHFRLETADVGRRNDVKVFFEAFFVENPANSSAVVGNGDVKEGGFRSFEGSSSRGGGGGGTDSSLATEGQCRTGARMHIGVHHKGVHGAITSSRCC